MWWSLKGPDFSCKALQGRAPGYNPSWPFERPFIRVITPFIAGRGPPCNDPPWEETFEILYFVWFCVMKNEVKCVLIQPKGDLVEMENNYIFNFWLRQVEDKAALLNNSYQQYWNVSWLPDFCWGGKSDRLWLLMTKQIAFKAKTKTNHWPHISLIFLATLPFFKILWFPTQNVHGKGDFRRAVNQKQKADFIQPHMGYAKA